MKTPHHLLQPCLYLIALFAFTFGMQPLFADTIHVPVGQQAADAPKIEMPTTGMSQARVKTLFGEPLETKEAVGNPPISSWKYADFVVYFQNDYVIHSVRSFKPKGEVNSEN